MDPVDIEVKGLSMDIDVSPRGLAAFVDWTKRKQNHREPRYKPFLQDISARISRGTLTAVPGSSGSGKTSLLNVLAQRIASTNLRISGTTSYNNGESFSDVRSAYVMQHDVLLLTLTVRKTLRYAADLRLPYSVLIEERRRVVEDVILELGLKDAANTRIGINIYKGCSGGEKRTSLGVQLLANPSVLFFDEVTTGLDATNAFQLAVT